MNTRPRGEHQLVIGDIMVQDKMNVKSVLKLIIPEVSDLLEQYYGEETKALVMYLKMMRFVYQAFEEKAENIKERLKKISYATFFLRIWKNMERSYNFVSLNAYTCVEINFHMIIDVYRKLRDSNSLQYFLPWKFSSQTCEEFFRTARSFTSTESTVINFTTNQFMHRVKRIQTVTDIKNCYEESSIVSQVFDVESIMDEEIVRCIDEGATMAVNDFLKLGVIPDLEKHLKIGLKPLKPDVKKEEEEENYIDSDCDIVITNDNENAIELL